MIKIFSRERVNYCILRRTIEWSFAYMLWGKDGWNGWLDANHSEKAIVFICSLRQVFQGKNDRKEGKDAYKLKMNLPSLLCALTLKKWKANLYVDEAKPSDPSFDQWCSCQFVCINVNHIERKNKIVNYRIDGNLIIIILALYGNLVYHITVYISWSRTHGLKRFFFNHRFACAWSRR